MLGELSRGVRHVEFDQTGTPPAGGPRLDRSSSNPFLTMPDPGSGRASGLVVCDSTAATPLHVRPLELGCDFVVHSATKFLAGHDDALVGAVVCKRPDDAARLLEFRSRTGPVTNADTAWLLLRGLATLEVRVGRQTDSAKVLAERLRTHSAVEIVRYPGFGGLMSFDVGSAGRPGGSRRRRN